MIAVSFGEIVENTPEIASRISDDNQAVLNSKEAALTRMMIYLDIEEAKKYQAGTFWNLTLDSEGSITIKRVE